MIPDEPDTPSAELVADLLDVPSHRHLSIGVASDRGQAVGTVRMVLDDMAGHEDLAELEYLIVRPERRRAGIGRGLSWTRYASGLNGAVSAGMCPSAIREVWDWPRLSGPHPE